MKSCDRIRKAAFQYLENSITPRERAEITTHLQNCAECAAAYAAAKHSLAVLRSLPRHKASGNFDVVLHARIRQAVHERRSYWPVALPGWSWQLPAYGAAAMLLIAAGALLDRKMDLLPSSPVSARISAITEKAPVVPAPVPQTLQAAASKSAAERPLQPEIREETTLDSGTAAALLAASMRGEGLQRQTAALNTGLVGRQGADRSAATRYVMQRIPMQTLLRQNQRALEMLRANQNQPLFDTMLVRETPARQRVPGVRQASASVQF